MRKSLLLCVLLCFVFCSSPKKQSVLLNELTTLGVKQVSISKNFTVSFRDSTDKIDWEWYKHKTLGVLSDSFMTKFFNEIPELKRWRGYQECTIDGYHTLNDSTQLLIVNNRVLNGNEANKYLIRFDNVKSVEKVFLLAKVEKSIDDLFEIFSVVNNGHILQTQTHIFIDEDSVITDKIVYEFKTRDFVYYECVKKDSVRIVELE